jgi:hypothetical protein
MALDGRAGGALLALVAVVLFLVAIKLARRALRLLRAGGRARGVIVGSEKMYGTAGGSSSRPSYRPTVRFTASDGSSRTFTSPVGRGKPWVEGTAVQVVYDPKRPDEAEIASFTANWLIPLMLGMFGAFILAVAAGLLTAH